MKLYEIDEAINEILSRVDPDTGELDIDFSELETLEQNKADKIEGVIRYYKNTIGESVKFADEIKRLGAIKKTLDNRASSLKEWLDIVELGKYGLHELKTRKSAVIEIINMVELDAKYIVVEEKPNKTMIKNAIKAGEVVAGAELVEKNNLVIK